jgi:hypothetical protein
MTTNTPMIAEVDCSTGIQTERPMTAQEIKDWEAVRTESAKLQAERDAEAQAKADAKLAAQSKLQALGLTGEEIAAITE